MSGVVGRLVKNTLSNFGMRLLEMMLTLVSVPVMLSALGEASFDLLVLVGALTGYFGLLGAGVPTGATKYVAEHHARGEWAQVEGVINTALLFFVLVGATVAGVLCVGLFLGLEGVFFEEAQRGEARRVLWVTAGLSLLSWPASAYEAALGGLQEHHERNKIAGGTRLLSQVLGILGAVSGLSLVWVYVLREAPTALRLVLLGRQVRRQVPGYRLGLAGLSRGTLRRVMGLSAAAFLGQLAGLLIYQTDKVILKAFFPGQGVLTLYTVIAKPYELVRTFSGMFNSAVMPAVSALEAREGLAGVREFAYQGARASNAFVGAMAIGAAYLGVPFIRLWVGERYAALAWITPALCLFQLVWQSNAMLGPLYHASGRALALSWIALGSALVNVALSLWLVANHGVEGVLLATMIAGVFTVPAQYLLIFPVLGIERWRYWYGSVWRGQRGSLLIGAALWPARGIFGGIDRWWELVVAAIVLGALLSGAVWWGLDEVQRGWLTTRVSAKLGLKRRGGPGPGGAGDGDPS